MKIKQRQILKEHFNNVISYNPINEKSDNNGYEYESNIHVKWDTPGTVESDIKIFLLNVYETGGQNSFNDVVKHMLKGIAEAKKGTK